jgi:hypothetical protein
MKFQLLNISLIWICLLQIVASDEMFKAMLLGRTGDGKSSLANLIAKFLGYKGDGPFGEGKSAASHTHDPQSIVVGNIKLTDTPGLMDTAGIDEDEKNLVKIVKDLKSDGFVNAFLLVINEKAPRFDDGMQTAVKLLYDTYGIDLFNHMGIVFTRSNSKTVEQAGSYVEIVKTMLQNRTGVQIRHIPYWQVDCYPEDLKHFGSSDEFINKIGARNELSLKSLKAWLLTQERVDVSKVMATEYEATRKLKAAAEAVKDAEATARKAKEVADKATEAYNKEKTKETKKLAEYHQALATQAAVNVERQKKGFDFVELLTVAQIGVIAMV